MKNKLFLSLLLTSIQMSGQVTAASCPLRFTEVCVANIDQTIDHSNNYGSWVELHNPTDDTVSIEGWYVSDDAGDLKKHRLQGAERIGPRGYGCLFFGHHADDGVYGADACKQVKFKLDREGGTVYLSPDGVNIGASIHYPPSIPRCSYALTSVQGNDWAYCGMPTPGAPNEGHYGSERMKMPEVDEDSRLFSGSFTVHATIPEGATLRYTTDGSTPTLENGKTSSDGCFSISHTTVLRLRLFADGFLPSGVATRTYIYKDREYYLPIVAVTTDPRNLYDDWIGCYVNGKNGILGRGSKVASNLNMDWERPINVEYLTADGRMVVNQEASFEVAGGYSRHFAPASFKVQAKKLYDGNGSFAYPVFAHKPYCQYKQLFVRNGGNNNRTDGGPRIKDAVTQQVLTSSGYYVDAQEYQPAHVFINGRYLAMMNVREPNNRFHGCANYGYDNDETDGFEYSNGGYHQKGGTRDAFDRLVACSGEASTDEGYEKVCRLLDMEEFVRYMAAICYTGSYDWLLGGNNVKGYRTQDDGKFHFVFFDQDLAWRDTDNVKAIDGVTTNEVLQLYNNLKRNPAFCRQFVASYCILHGCVYTPERCQAVADSICALVGDALAFDYRYTGKTYGTLQKEMWGADYRQSRIRSLAAVYGLGEGMDVTVCSNLPHARIRLEGQDLPFGRFSGTLFGQERMDADAADGYAFLGWQDPEGNWMGESRDCTVTRSGTYTAVFETERVDDVPTVCINEVSAANDIFTNDYGKRADWIELYNRGREPIDVAALHFSDDSVNPTKYRLDAAPSVTTIVPPDGHIVIWCDGRPSLSQPHLPFKLKNMKDGFLSLHDAAEGWTDSIRYNMHSSKETVGRYPDGGCSYYTFYHPTIGNRNMHTLYDTFIRTTPNAIDPPPSSGEIVSAAFYTLDGRRASPQSPGLYIRQTRYRDGRSVVRKVMMPVR